VISSSKAGLTIAVCWPSANNKEQWPPTHSNPSPTKGKVKDFSKTPFRLPIILLCRPQTEGLPLANAPCPLPAFSQVWWAQAPTIKSPLQDKQVGGVAQARSSSGALQLAPLPPPAFFSQRSFVVGACFRTVAGRQRARGRACSRQKKRCGYRRDIWISWGLDFPLQLCRGGRGPPYQSPSCSRGARPSSPYTSANNLPAPAASAAV